MASEVPEPILARLFEVLACNSSVDSPDATEAAFIQLMKDCCYPYAEVRKKLMPTEQSYSKIVFTSYRKKSATILRKDDGVEWLLTFGSAEYILTCCERILTKGNVETELELNAVGVLGQKIREANRQSLRTLAVAYKRLKPGEGGEDHLRMIGEERYEVEESGLTFVGLLGLKDPLRDGVRDAVQALHDAGIIVRMVTGDSRATATAIAKDCGIMPHGDTRLLVMEGTEFESRVGGLGSHCRICDQRDNRFKAPVEEEKESTRGVVDIKCPSCGSELWSAARDMDEFGRIAKKLAVIAVCRPSDKYLLVSSLRYM